MSLGPELVWARTPTTPVVVAALSWLNVMRPGVARTDVTMRMLWEKDIGDRQTCEIKGRMEEHGLDLWDWYVVPAGALDQAFGGRAQWVEGVGAWKMCTLPEVLPGREKLEGELWFVGGEQAFATID